MKVKYRLWRCKTCGASFNVSLFFPDGSPVDTCWNGFGTAGGFDSVNQTVTCCDHPNVFWDNDCGPHTWEEVHLLVLDEVDYQFQWYPEGNECMFCEKYCNLGHLPDGGRFGFRGRKVFRIPQDIPEHCTVLPRDNISRTKLVLSEENL